MPTPENPEGTCISPEMQVRTDAEGDGWRVPPRTLPPDQVDGFTEWMRPRRSWQPMRTFTQPSRFANPQPELERTYVY